MNRLPLLDPHAALEQITVEVHQTAKEELPTLTPRTSREKYILVIPQGHGFRLLPPTQPEDLWKVLEEYVFRVHRLIYQALVRMPDDHQFVATFIVDRKLFQVLLYDERARGIHEWKLSPEEVESFTADLIQSKFFPPNPHLARIRDYVFSPELN